MVSSVASYDFSPALDQTTGGFTCSWFRFFSCLGPDNRRFHLQLVTISLLPWTRQQEVLSVPSYDFSLALDQRTGGFTCSQFRFLSCLGLDNRKCHLQLVPISLQHWTRQQKVSSVVSYDFSPALDQTTGGFTCSWFRFFSCLGPDNRRFHLQLLTISLLPRTRHLEVSSVAGYNLSPTLDQTSGGFICS